MKSRKMIVMISLMVIVVIILEILLFNTVWAFSSSFVSRTTSECGHYTPPPTPSDASQTTIPSTPSTPSEDTPSDQPQPDPNAVQEEYVDIYYNAAFEGNVLENVGYSNGGSEMSEDGETPEDSHASTIGIKDILINATSGGTIQMRTNDSGHYYFAPSPGTYSINAQYGKLDGFNMSDSGTVKNILKYNGQDYITVAAPGAQNHEGSEGSITNTYYTRDTTTEEIEISQGGKGVSQVMIALDCSYSMRPNELEPDNKRLEVAVNSAKELCSEVINQGDNIYIGLVFFSGTCYRAVSLTRDLNKLNDALNEILSNGWQTPNTNMVSALDKAYESFINNGEDSNRYITVITDGIPTSDGNVKIYNEDQYTPQVVYDKLDNDIVPNTINKIEEVKEKGVKVYSILTYSDDADETYYANKIYKEHSNEFRGYRGEYNEENVRKTINTIFRNYLIEHKEIASYIDPGYVVTAGYEDPDRRSEVDANFSNPFSYSTSGMNSNSYSKSEIFKQIESTEAIDPSKSQELSDKTYMNVSAGTVTIDPVPACPSDDYIYDIDPETKETKLKKIIHYRVVPVTVEIGDIVLTRRPTFALQTQATVTGLRIVLANGQVLATKTVSPGSIETVKLDLDNDLIHSATVQLEYTIGIKNASSIQCEHVEVISSVPQDFVYDENINLISENISNKDVGWDPITDLLELKDQNLITEETLDSHKKRKEIRMILDNGGQGENGFYVTPGQVYSVRFVVSRMIGNLDNISDIINKYDMIDTEILAYQNQAHRRMEYYKNVSSDLSSPVYEFLGIYPGDSQDMDYSGTSSNVAAIIPPTGKQEISIVKKIKNEIKLILPLDEIKKILKAMGIK